MFCLSCKTKIAEEAPFCLVCGRSTSLTDPVTFSANPEAVERKMPAIIRCQQCGYEGRGEFARSIPVQVIIWFCLFILPIAIPVYFALTYKYRCPKCKTTFIMIKNRQGQFEKQTGSRRAIKVLKYFAVGVVSLVVLFFIAAFVSKYF